VDKGVQFRAQHIDGRKTGSLRRAAGRVPDQRDFIQHFGGASGSEHMDAPVKWRRAHGGQCAGDAIGKVQRHDGGIKRGRALLPRIEPGINVAHRPEHADKGVQYVKSGASQSAARRFRMR